MEDHDLKNLFQKASYHPESRLSDGILLAISKKEIKMTRIKFWGSSTIGVVSFIGLFPIIGRLISDFSQSGFYQYITLIFTDNIAINYWKEISLSIAESIPMTSLTLSLAVIFIFTISLRYMARNFIRRSLLIA